MRHLPTHLAELATLLGRPVRPDQLCSLAETRALRERVRRVQVPPSGRRWARLPARRFGALLRELPDRDVYLWTPLSNVCGLHRPVRLGSIDLGRGRAILEGLLVIVSADLADRLLIELSTSELGEVMVDVEIWGTAWRRLARHGDGFGALEDTWTSLTLPGE